MQKTISNKYGTQHATSSRASSQVSAEAGMGVMSHKSDQEGSSGQRPSQEVIVFLIGLLNAIVFLIRWLISKQKQQTNKN